VCLFCFIIKVCCVDWPVQNSPHFPDLGISWRWVVSFMPRPLYPRGKSPRYPLDRRAPEPVWTTLRRENSWPYRDSNCDPLVVQPVASRYTDCAIPALSGLQYMIKMLACHTSFVPTSHGLAEALTKARILGSEVQPFGMRYISSSAVSTKRLGQNTGHYSPIHRLV
jgi:hypothetical protein